jgi:hypothetical protein
MVEVVPACHLIYDTVVSTWHERCDCIPILAIVNVDASFNLVPLRLVSIYPYLGRQVDTEIRMPPTVTMSGGSV